MSSFRKPMMMFLAAFWLLATEHCALQAAGVWFDQDHVVNCSGSDQKAPVDGCKLVEAGDFKLPLDTLKVRTPELARCIAIIYACALHPAARQDSDPCLAELVDRPLGWIPTWSFERRAAPSPRAPSVVLA